MLSAAGKGALSNRLQRLYLVPEISRNSRSIGSPRPKEPQRLKGLSAFECECAFGVGQSNAQVTPCRVQLTLSIHSISRIRMTNGESWSTATADVVDPGKHIIQYRWIEAKMF